MLRSVTQLALPAGFLDRSRLRTRFTDQAEPVARLSVLFQNHLDRSTREIEHHIIADKWPAEFVARTGTMARIYGLSYVLSGRAVVTDAQQGRLVVQEGDLIQFHGVDTVSIPIQPEPGFMECSLCVDHESGRRLIEDGVWDESWVVSRVGDAPTIIRAYYELFDSLEDRGISDVGIRRRLLRVLEVAYDARTAADPEMDFIVRAKRLLEERLEPAYTQEHAAKDLGCSAVSFRRRFLAKVGITPAQWQQRRRLERAMELLAHHSVREVSEKLGYSHPAVFSRQFRQMIGIQPVAMTRQRR